MASVGTLLVNPRASSSFLRRCDIVSSFRTMVAFLTTRSTTKSHNSRRSRCCKKNTSLNLATASVWFPNEVFSLATPAYPSSFSIFLSTLSDNVDGRSLLDTPVDMLLVELSSNAIVSKSSNSGEECSSSDCLNLNETQSRDSAWSLPSSDASIRNSGSCSAARTPMRSSRSDSSVNISKFLVGP